MPVENTNTGAPEGSTAPKFGTAEYEVWATEQAQARLASKGTTPPAQQTVEETPPGEQLILGKFKTQEDLAAAYQAAQAELTRVKQGKPATETPSSEATPPGTAPKIEQQQQPTTADTSKYATEFQQTGKLSDESYAELAAKGFDKSFVDTYIAGQQALAEQAKTTLLNSVGGEAKFTEMSTWAQTGMTDEELDTYNEHASNPATAKMALTYLKTIFEARNGSAPAGKRIQGETTDTTAQGFKSREEAIQAQRDPRYQRDPAYRAWHERMLSNRKY